MSQVSLLSVDVGQNPDIQGGKGEAANKNQAKGSAFSDVMEQHYSTKNVIESGSSIKQRGNIVSQAATPTHQANSIDGSLKQAKEIKAGDAHTLPVPLPVDDEALAQKPNAKLKASDDAHTLPVPLPVDDEALAAQLIAKFKASDDAHTLPVPLPVDDEALAAQLIAKLKTSDDAHTLPVPLPVDDEALSAQLIAKLKTSDDAHTLPVPLPVDDEALAAQLIAKLKTSDDAHTLPVPISPNGEKLTAIARSKDDAHILPVPVTPSSEENKTVKQGGVTVKYELNAEGSQQNLYAQRQVQAASSGNGNSDNDAAVDLLNMLNGAQKLLVKSSAEQLPLSANAGDGAITKSHVDSNNATKTFTEKLSALDTKQITTAQTIGNSLAIEQALNDEQIVKQINAQTLIQESKFAIDNNQSAISVQTNSELKSALSVGGNDLELAMSKNNISAKASAISKELTSEGDNAKVPNSKQAHVADVMSVNGNEQTQARAVNQSTASVINAQSMDAKHDSNQKVAMHEATDKSVRSDVELDKLASTQSEKKIPLAENTTSSFNQTLDAQATKSMLSPGELTAQQEQSFESTINKITTDTVQTQKAITAINTETIAIYRKDFANAVKDKVMVMINQKIQQVEIQLDPPEMGNIHVRVNLQNEQAAVQFIVQNQQAKDALEQNMGKLRDMLAENGVDVGDANIEQREAKEQNSQDLNGQANSGQHGESGEDIHHDNDNSVLNLAKASSTGVDYYA